MASPHGGLSIRLDFKRAKSRIRRGSFLQQKWCRGAELNCLRRPFQGRALPVSYLGTSKDFTEKRQRRKAKTRLRASASVPSARSSAPSVFPSCASFRRATKSPQTSVCICILIPCYVRPVTLCAVSVAGSSGRTTLLFDIAREVKGKQSAQAEGSCSIYFDDPVRIVVVVPLALTKEGRGQREARDLSCGETLSCSCVLIDNRAD
jgi:hypothetical protein